METADKRKEQAMAKSMVILDVKPRKQFWGPNQTWKTPNTDLKELEHNVRSIKMDGMIWGEGKLLEVGDGVQKLQIAVTIEDAKVSVDTDLVERIQKDFEGLVQSVDVVSFSKV